MEDRGTLIAVDKAKSKIHKLRENLSAAGVTIAQVFSADASKICTETDKSGSVILLTPPPSLASIF